MNLKFTNSPFKFIVFIYFLSILFFAFLYSLPISQIKHIDLIDAFFLSTSGISITGLTTIGLNEHLSYLGKIFLLIEIQFGGIGIMVILGSFFMLFNKNLSLFQQTLLTFDTNQLSLKSIKKLTIFIFCYTFLIELLGTLFFYFYVKVQPEESNESFFLSLFHAVSSFTNSGFDLFQGTINEFSNYSLFLLFTSLLLILGSIGFPSVLELSFKKKNKKISLYTKINLIMHGILLMAGFILFFVLEFNNNLKGLSLGDKLSNAFFLSSTTRNGGFASLPVQEFDFTTIFIIMILMFIGGSASSCGGGIRVTTLFVVFARAYNTIRGRNSVVVFKKTLYDEDINKAHLIFFSFISIFVFSVILLSSIEPLPFTAVAFEIMSALTTTGLSMGITEDLNSFSQLYLCLLMIIGRIGIIALIYSLIKPSNSTIKYSKEHIIVG